ncbi:MAG TPA: sulfotransferase [Acidimicrobiia bacterium]|jgi:hypothetical protein
MSWAAFADSDAFRTLTKRGPGRALLRSRPVSELDLIRKRLHTTRRSDHASEHFDRVTTFCAFVGHNKSGSSLCSALLDAHPEIVLSDEVDLLRYVERGFRRDQLFALAARGARAEARKGRITARRLEPYSYAVAGGSQGRAPQPRVVGDSTTGTSTRRFGSDPYLWTRITVEVRPARATLLHVIRNPFDPISVMMVRGHRSFANSIDHYFDACETLARIRRQVAPSQFHEVRYEDLVATPRDTLRAMCTFLGVGTTASYLDACAAVVAPRPAPRRAMVEWTQPWITTVEDRIAEHDFLKGYSYDC